MNILCAVLTTGEEQDFIETAENKTAWSSTCIFIHFKYEESVLFGEKVSSVA